MAFLDRLAKAVAVGGGGEFEEARRVANEPPVFNVCGGIRRRRAASRRQVELDTVEVPQHPAPLAVDRAVAFVRNHEIEVVWRDLPILRNHGLQGSDGDALGAVEKAAGSKDVAGVLAEMIGEGVLGLFRQGYAVHKEKDPCDDARLEQPLDESRRRARLAGSRGHLDQQFASSLHDLGAERLDALDLIMAVDYLPVDGDGRRVAPDLARRQPPFQVVLRVEARDLPCVSVGFTVEEPYLLAVREKDEWYAELLGIVPTLVLGPDRIDGRSLCLKCRHGATLAVAEHIVGPGSVRQNVLEQDARTVEQIPARILEQGVDLCPGKCLRRIVHPSRIPAS